MNGYLLYSTIRGLIGLALIIPIFLCSMGFLIHEELALQSSYRARFSDAWKEHYQQEQRISVAEGNRKIFVAIGGMVVIPVILFFIYRQIVPKERNGARSRRPRGMDRKHILPKVEESRDKQSMNSPSRQYRPRRGARYRRNAAIGIPCGFLIVLAGVILTLFRCGIFADYSAEFVLGLFLFFAGYFTVIFGCWSWAMAKHLNDGIVMVGLVPLVLLLIPFVRRIIFYAPQFVAMGMILAPAILTLTIAILPSRR